MVPVLEIPIAVLSVCEVCEIETHWFKSSFFFFNLLFVPLFVPGM